MAESLVLAIGRGWRDPRGAMAAQVARGLSEPQALFHLMLAAGLFCVASLPAALETARGLDISDPVQGAVAAHIFAYLCLAPLVGYGLAALVHLAARAFGAQGGFLVARAALFWAALLGAPMALGLAALRALLPAGGGVGRLPWLALPGYAAMGFWLWLFAASLAEAEGFAETRKVAAVVVLAFGSLAALLAILSGGPARAV
jgi:hypothetical protein